MTDQTRETLTELELSVAEHLTNEKEAYGSRIARVSVDASDLAALRDVLTPRTCGTCRHATDEQTRDTVEHGYVAVVCVKRGGYWRADDGCIKGWQAREGEGGGR